LTAAANLKKQRNTMLNARYQSQLCDFKTNTKLLVTIYYNLMNQLFRKLNIHMQ
jgi:hypothetical protein